MFVFLGSTSPSTSRSADTMFVNSAEVSWSLRPIWTKAARGPQELRKISWVMRIMSRKVMTSGFPLSSVLKAPQSLLPAAPWVTRWKLQEQVVHRSCPPPRLIPIQTRPLLATQLQGMIFAPLLKRSCTLSSCGAPSARLFYQKPFYSLLPMRSKWRHATIQLFLMKRKTTFSRRWRGTPSQDF